MKSPKANNIDVIVLSGGEGCRFRQVVNDRPKPMRYAYNNLVRYFQLYNSERIHESLGYRIPHEVYFGDGRNNDGEACRLIQQIQPIFVS